MVPQQLIKFAILSGTATKPSKNKLWSKITLEYASILSQKFGFSYKFVNSTDGEFGRLLPNGTWTGIVGMLHRGEVDACLTLSLAEDRFRVLDFTYPTSISPVTFLTRKPEYIPEAATFLKPFSLGVWIAFCLCLMLMIFFLKVLLLKKEPLINLIMHVYGIVAGQSLHVRVNRISDFFLVSGLVISVTFLIHSYLAVLSSILTIPPLSGVRTIPELAKAVSEGKYYCTSFPGSYITKVLVNSDNPDLNIIGESMKKSKGVTKVENSFHTKNRQRAAFVHGRLIFVDLTWKYFASEDSFFLVQIGFAMRKDFSYKERFEKLVKYLWHSGIHKKIEDDAAFEAHDFSVSDESHEDTRPLSMQEFKGIFYFLIAGHILSVIILILEITIKNCSLENPVNFLK